MTGDEPARIAVYGCGPDEAGAFRALAARLPVAPVLTEAPVSAANAAMAAGARCVSVGHRTLVPEATLLALKAVGVEYVSTRSAGLDHVDVACAEALGMRVGNVEYAPDGVADFTVMLVLMALRDARSAVLRADVHDYRPAPERGRELRDLTVGVVGTGRIGGAVVDRLRGFGCRVLAYDRRPKVDAEYAGLDRLLEESDVVTLHTPLNEGTRHLLDRRRIGRMRPGAVLVNTGRGALVDTEALLEALEAGRLGGAALDVVEGEEGVFYADHRGGSVGSDALVRLQKLPNVVVTPHTAYYTDRALRDTVAGSVAACLRYEERGQDG
ncbi:NAD(P)-dependent oxidoreductase [Glycomyces paridis]|uniref:Lactate dehydrogenase n=1 Tax=Glycomyces paridis TaxID=2126555 RepID=A0A4S8PHS8_9ACTN|nr:NAD(P)-dependent oxidoreductase [Glycomyces paridis]THV29511.1 lactate dehydrogenase [Glycomyces paridis]